MSEETKEKAAEFGRKLKGFIDKGVDASKKGLKTAGNKISDFGDISVHQIEIQQLKSKLEKVYKEIGECVSSKILSGEADSVSKDEECLSQKLADVSDLKAKIAANEEQIQRVKDAAKDASK